MKQVAGRLRLDLAQFRDLEAFAKFGSDLDKVTQLQITRGQRMVEILKQGQYTPLVVEKQIAIIFLGVNGFLDSIPADQVLRLETEYLQFMESNYADVLKSIAEKKKLDDDLQKKMMSIGEEFIKSFVVEE